MYKIEITQVKNGWICSISLHKQGKISSHPLENMMGNLMKNIEGEDKLTTIQENNEYTGTHVFLKYKDLIGFLSFITE